MRNQVFSRDSQGPSIHRGKAGTYSGDGLPVFVWVQEKNRERDEESVCVCICSCVVTLASSTCLHKGRKNKGHLVNPQRTVLRLGQVLIP